MEIIIVLISLLFGAFAAFLFFNSKLSRSNEKNIQLQATLNEKEKYFAEKMQFVEQMKSQMNSDFKTLATDILNTDRDKLKTENSELLTPLQVQLNSFRERIETITTEQVKDRTSLGEQIKGLHKANLETQQSAQNLTKALTHDNKFQGD